MYTEYYLNVDWDAECESESDARSKILPKPYTKEDETHNIAGIWRMIIISAILICDLQFGMNLLTILGTVAAVPLVIHLKD